MANGPWDGTHPSLDELKTRAEDAMATSRYLIEHLHEVLEEHHRLNDYFVQSHARADKQLNEMIAKFLR